MMTLGSIGFLAPWLLAGLVVLPLIWWLLRFIPPKPQRIVFPPTRLLKGLQNDDQTPENSPWWLTALRVLLAALIILALARPILNPDREALSGSGPVIIVVDNGWASASHWNKRQDFISTLIGRAERQNREIIIVPSAGDGVVGAKTLTPDQAREFAASMAPLPFRPNRQRLAAKLAEILGEQKKAAVIWLSDGLDYGHATEFARAMRSLVGDDAGVSIVQPQSGSQALGLYSSMSDSGVLTAHILRAKDGGARAGRIRALTSRGEQLAEAAFELAAGELHGRTEFEIPLEIRNQVARLEIQNERSAGAVHLLDARSQWRRVGIISGEARELAQPLLSPLYYVERALTPYAEIVSSQDRNVVRAVNSTLEQDVSVLILADIGKLVAGTLDELEKWVEDGGTLVRFAGQRLEQGGDRLLPHALRRGGRALGGSLSWSSPQALAPFDTDSPFSGLQPPKDILVKRQVLTDPAQNTQSSIWARLVDGTPLVSAAKRGKGRIVLFHITANSEWSNLPMSGLFVEMLRRLVERSAESSKRTDGAGVPIAATEGIATDGLLTPQLVLNGFGDLESPAANVAPLKAATDGAASIGPDHPPGYYGPIDTMRALNLLDAKSTLLSLETNSLGLAANHYGADRTIELKYWLLVAAFALLLVDAVAILALSMGLMSSRPAAALARLAAPLLAASLVFAPDPGQAAGAKDAEDFAFQAALKTRLAYVITGDGEIDRVSKAGLSGLSKVLAARTAVEPSDPMGVDVNRDELAFFPLLYWPVHADSKSLPDSTLAKIDAYMKQGGIILFDTRDFHLSPSSSGDVGQGPAAKALARLVGTLDIPPLAPVHESHVLTKSFYLMRGFPGRWDGSPLWAEATADENSAEGERARRSDGVSSILITSNDFAAAWALDQRNQPLFPVVPGGEMQREMAFRSGVNIVMYALTGNYKADQVHVPALLERLGQ